eukprot:COSAG02_NODE_3885_length_6087_cov_7.811456_7_plen_367_part_00
MRLLRTDMDYLRRSMHSEQLRAQQHVDQFEHQRQQIEQAGSFIEDMKATLVGLGVMRSSAVLTCDWMNVESTPFKPCKAVDAEPCVNARGCHVPVVEQHLDSRQHPNQVALLGSTYAETYACFDTRGEPQGCHAYAMHRIEQARFRVGCSRRWDPLLWGWCGDYPWSAYMNPGDWEDDTSYGCTTLLDIFQLVWQQRDLAFQLTCSLLGFYYVQRSLTSLQTGLEKTKAGVTDLQARASGAHGRSYVNRVSLSLNLLLPASSTEDGSADDQKQKLKLLPRTLWERDLSEFMTDPEQRQHFRAAAKMTTEIEPFLRDSLESAEREERKLVINLFSNLISSICSTNFVILDLGEVVHEESYVFGLTFE